MNTVRSTISMSVDGYITGPDDNHDHPLGVEGERLHDWMFDPESAANEINAHVRREMSEGIGAVVIGRRMFDLGWEPWGRANPFGAPLVVTTHREDEPNRELKANRRSRSSPAASMPHWTRHDTWQGIVTS